MNVEYISHMGSDDFVCDAARVSFDKAASNFSEEQNKKLIDYLAKHNHFTPFSHPQITLRVKAPLFVRTQLFKHKVGLTENEVSRRYVDGKPEFYVPDEWRGRPTDGMKQGSSEEIVEEILTGCGDEEEYTKVEHFYNEFIDIAAVTYEMMVDAGIAPEQARMVLPQSLITSWYWTGSLSAFARVCNLRLDSHAQRETQEVAKMIYDIVEPLFPYSMKALVNVS